ncbi:MAG: carnitine 3-dehydrogenase [Rhodobacteraceae bacterium]|nr:carnitine 3-dehydrogenase [Paracoccaceae bacterium]
MTRTAAIIGGGVIGGGWAARFALMGWDVRVFDPDPEAERKIGEILANARRSLPMLYDRDMPLEGTVRFVETMSAAVDGATWIQESVPERLEMKQQVYQTLQATCDPAAILASSTSGFRPSQLQEGAARPEQIMVAHPFNPVYLLPLVELVPSAKTAAKIQSEASDILTQIGMFALPVRAEIDAHIADRFLEAVWREALWLVKDGIATTEEIDNAIRYGFGLRWAQMGLFETYRVAGGEAGMKHFMAQFGPALKWPWTKLMDVPEFNDALVDLIVEQSDAQSGHMGIRALETLRDNNLVAMLRSLKQQDAAAGALLNAHQRSMRKPLDETVPLVTVRRTVPVDWTDYNGHMNESRYGQVFSDAADALMIHVGADDEYISNGNSYFTAETHVKYLAETHAGDAFYVATRVLIGDGKKLKAYHEMRTPEGEVIATCEQFMLHVNLTTRKSCPPLPDVLARVEAVAAAHKDV